MIAGKMSLNSLTSRQKVRPCAILNNAHLAPPTFDPKRMGTPVLPQKSPQDSGRPLVFSYSEGDVERRVSSPSGWTRAHYSEFDQLLCSQWDQAVKDGVFRYRLDEVTSRILPGRYGFVVQRNPKRFSHRRKPTDMHSVSQPFNHDTFNFNKANKKEVLLEVRREEVGGVSHWLIVNVSPIDYGHVLLVPQPDACLPQIMTEESVQMCLDIMTLSSHRGFCMVANSLLAYASVNHLHYHFMYIAQPLLGATVTGKPFTKNCYELVDHPSCGFGFELDTKTADCAKSIFKVISLLIEFNIPHNLMMVRGDPFNQSLTTPTEPVIRTLLIPRKPAYGLKGLFDSGDVPPPFFAAACELGLGFIPVLDQSQYDTLTEECVLQVLSESSLSQIEYQALRTRVLDTL